MSGFHGELTGKSQCSFRTGHEVGDDVEWVVVTYEREDIQTRHILNGIFEANTLAQGFIGTYPVA